VGEIGKLFGEARAGIKSLSLWTSLDYSALSGLSQSLKIALESQNLCTHKKRVFLESA